MLVVGLLGGVASGKSLVAKELARLGAGVLDADRAGHEVLRLPKVEQAARQRWGQGVFGPDGHIDRPRLARLVFAAAPMGPVQREYLEQLTHPEIRRLLMEQAEQMEASGRPLAVLDAPLLLEAGWDKFCSILLMVDVPRDVRLARALGRGWTEAEFAAREAVQERVDVKRARAHRVIDNSGSPEQTRVQVEQFWQSLVEGPAAMP
jgi:dephospho-CoA kinase